MVFITLKILSGTVWRIEQALFPAVVAVVVDDVCSFWLVVVVDINLVDINSTPLRGGDWFDILRVTRVIVEPHTFPVTARLWVDGGRRRDGQGQELGGCGARGEVKHWEVKVKRLRCRCGRAVVVLLFQFLEALA